MKIKQNKKGSALVFTIVILSIGTIVALSLAASSVISRKGASSTERASRSFQEIDSGSDAFDRVFEKAGSFLCEVRDYYHADGNPSSVANACCQGDYDLATDTCNYVEPSNGETAFGKCNTSGSLNGKLTSKDGKSVTTIYDKNNVIVPCYSGLKLTVVTKTRTVAVDDQNKRAIENVPPCAGYEPDEHLIGHWKMNSLKTATTIDDETSNNNDMELKFAVAPGESQYKDYTNASSGLYLPEIYRFNDGVIDKNALYINRNYNTAIACDFDGFYKAPSKNGYICENIDHANRTDNSNNFKDTAKIDVSNHVNSRFNWAQIPPIDAYAVAEGSVSFWFYSTNPNPQDWGFTPYSRDITNCVNEKLIDENDSRLTRNNLTMYTGWGGGWRIGLCQNGQNDYWPYPTSGSEKPANYTVNELNFYNTNNGNAPTNKYEHICDCGHFSPMWNSHYWTDPDLEINPYKDVFGTRFQNDGNGSHYRLVSSTMSAANITNKWHLVTVTFDSSGAYLYFDEELRGTIWDGSSPPWANGTSPNIPFKFDGLAGNFNWTYIGQFAGDQNSTLYNELDPTDSDFTENKVNYMNDQFSANRFTNDKMLFYPFRGGIREVRLYDKKLKECEVRRLWWETGKAGGT